MLSNKTLARIAGLFYLIVAVGGGFSELFVRSSVRVPHDAAATAANIVAHSTLFRVGFVTDLVDFACFLGVGLVMYAILRPVNPPIALAMVVINAISVAIQALNMLNHLGALLVATDPRYTAGLSTQASQSLVLFLLEMHRQGYLIAQIFFGLYLLPLGYLVYKSGYFPKVLGAILMIGCGGYLAGIVAVYVSPVFASTPSLYFATLGGVAELIFLLWLLIVGAKTGGGQGVPPQTVDWPRTARHRGGSMNMKSRLSTLWLFATLNYLYCDVVTLMDPNLLKQFLAGNVGSIAVSQGFLLGAAVLVEIPISMVLLSRVLNYRANRWANIIAGVTMTAVQLLSLVVKSPAPYYIFFSVIEIASTSAVLWFAWKWALAQPALPDQTKSLHHASVAQ